ncbi:MAG: GGDEF domain-containing protein, partial [Eggerthellaceae bacterium]|nr:GGDEF domain-containing protein [Eggerthellaceae bacterium]
PVPVLVLSGAQMIFPPGLPTMQGGVLVALLLLYGTTQNVMITRDHLTDLPNRFAFEQDLLSRISHFQPRGPQHLYIFAGDLDKFKSINDTYGHPVGDMALQLASKTLRDVFSSYDAVVFRTGGDEFMMTSETERILDIEEIRRNVNERLSAIEMPNQIHLSMSLGMEEYDGTLDFRELIDSADKKLYEAKRLSA